MSAFDPTTADGEVALTEYDADPRDVVGNLHRASVAEAGTLLPYRLLMTLLGDVSRSWVRDAGFELVYTVNMVTYDVPIWVGVHRGERIAVAEVPVGAPAAVIVMDQALMLGARTVVATGCAGALVHHEAGAMVVPDRALRDEGTSFHYLPPARWVETHPGVRATCVAAVEAAGLPVLVAPTWTTDALFRETPAKVAARREEGCELVEMECAAFAAVAQYRGARFAQILFAADTLAGEEHDVRGWGNDFRPVALRVALDAITRL